MKKKSKAKDKDSAGHKERILRLLIYLLQTPGGRTRQELANLFDVGPATIRNDFAVFDTVGIPYSKEENPPYRYSLGNEKPLNYLREFLLFTEEDQAKLIEAIDKSMPPSHRREMLKRKLATLYDFQRIGHSYARLPYLAKVDALTAAREQKQRVILEQYRSTNSNVVSDRLVEPFHLNLQEDIVQTYDVAKKELRYFRISRFKRVRPTDQAWAYETRHFAKSADHFHIVDDQQAQVHLRLKVGAYNDLMERFPLCSRDIIDGEEPDTYDLHTKVNSQFIGLSSFILGNFEGVEILEPEELREHIREKAKRMLA
jgi:predicted DNA-binding transcriptional regulator YafY